MPSKIAVPWRREGLVITVETPEQTQVELRLAPFGGRIAAAFLDYVVLLFVLFILSCLTVAVLLLLAGMEAFTGMENVLGYVVAATGAAAFLVQTFYYVVLELRMEGRTLGKRLMGYRSVMASGHGLTFGGSVIRNLARIVDHLPVFWIVPGLDPSRRRIGDMLANTLVVEVEQPRHVPIPLHGRDQGAGPGKFHFPAGMREKVSPEDIDLLEHFFHRLPTVEPPARRLQFIRVLARRYSGRLELDAAKVDEDPRRFLEELYFFVKDRFEGRP